jgi:hypothetical protein
MKQIGKLNPRPENKMYGTPGDRKTSSIIYPGKAFNQNTSFSDSSVVR